MIISIKITGRGLFAGMKKKIMSFVIKVYLHSCLYTVHCRPPAKASFHS